MKEAFKMQAEERKFTAYVLNNGFTAYIVKDGKNSLICLTKPPVLSFNKLMFIIAPKPSNFRIPIFKN